MTSTAPHGSAGLQLCRCPPPPGLPDPSPETPPGQGAWSPAARVAAAGVRRGVESWGPETPSRPLCPCGPCAGGAGHPASEESPAQRASPTRLPLPSPPPLPLKLARVFPHACRGCPACMPSARLWRVRALLVARRPAGLGLCMLRPLPPPSRHSLGNFLTSRWMFWLRSAALRVSASHHLLHLLLLLLLP